jgi:FixJ family two-component response regulator
MRSSGRARAHDENNARRGYRLKEFDFVVQAFSSAEEFLASGYVDETKCSTLDVAMPGMTGPDLQQELKIRRQEIPIVFTSPAYSVEAIRPG